MVVGQPLHLRIGRQAHSHQLLVQPLTLAIGRVGGDQHPARFLEGPPREVQRGGAVIQVGLEERRALAGFQVGHEDVAVGALIVDGDIDIAPFPVHGNVGVLGLVVQLGIVLEVQRPGASAHALGVARDHAALAAGAHAHVVRPVTLGVHLAQNAVFLQVPGKDTQRVPLGIVHHEAPVATVGRRRPFGLGPGRGRAGPDLLQAVAEVCHLAHRATFHVQLVEHHAQAVGGHEVQQVGIGGVPLQLSIASRLGEPFHILQRVAVVQVPGAVVGTDEDAAAIGIEGLAAGVVVPRKACQLLLGMIGDAHHAVAVGRISLRQAFLRPGQIGHALPRARLGADGLEPTLLVLGQERGTALGAGDGGDGRVSTTAPCSASASSANRAGVTTAGGRTAEHQHGGRQHQPASTPWTGPGEARVTGNRDSCGMGHHGRGSRLPDANAAGEERAKFSHDAARNGKACCSILSWKRCAHAAQPNTKRKKRDRDGRLCQVGRERQARRPSGNRRQACRPSISRSSRRAPDA